MFACWFSSYNVLNGNGSLFVPQLNKFMRLRSFLICYFSFFISFGFLVFFSLPSFSNPYLCFVADIDIELLESMHTKS